MPKNILLIGADGQLGQIVAQQLKQLNDVHIDASTIDTLDITNKEQVEAKLLSVPYDYLINCSAYTAVDKAEDEFELAEKINSEALHIIGEITNQQSTKVVHVSTDYVFDGTSYFPYSEEAPTHPVSAYGKTKLWGEQKLLEANPQSIVIRTSWLYSAHGHNFVKTMLRLGQERDTLNVVADQVGTPTLADDLAQAILHIVREDLTGGIPFEAGIYHYSNEGVTSWYDFTVTIFKIAGINCKVTPIETKDYPTAAPRPHYSVLNKAKIKRTYQMEIPHWQTSLEKCLVTLLNKAI